jgi:threonine dehydrogenase-like Zn-dependent dehydrogenase
MDKGNVSPGLMIGFCNKTGGGWGEYVVVHESQVFKIPDNVTSEEALIAEPLACAIHGVLKKLPEDDDNCVVVGCGTIGLVTIIALKALSKCNVFAIAKYPFQSEMAKNLGADEVHVIKKDMHLKKIARKLGSRLLSPPMEISYPIGGGADVVFDSVGNASSLTDSLRLVKSKGTVVLIGYPSYIETNWAPIIAKEITVVGSNVFGHDNIDGERKPTLQIALDLISSGKANVKDFITHKFKLEDYKNALSTAIDKSNNIIKAAFTFE